jgi:hypothetical protein
VRDEGACLDCLLQIPAGGNDAAKVAVTTNVQSKVDLCTLIKFPFSFSRLAFFNNLQLVNNSGAR